jgi:hypothetical protein
MDASAASFRAAAQTAQAGAGIVAARHRGDLASADALLNGIDDRTKAAGFLFLADVAIALLAAYEDRPVDQVAADLSLDIAAHLANSMD